MVLFSLSRRINKLLAPPLLRYGLSARYAMGKRPTRDNPVLDALFLIPLAQKMIALEVHEDATEKLKRASHTPSAFGAFFDRMFDNMFGKGPDEEYHTVEDVKKMNPRLQAFESFMRPILVPNERWSDVMRWQFQIRFLNWVRVEFLRAKYGFDLKESIEAYPRLRQGPQASTTRVKRVFGFLLPADRVDEHTKWLSYVPSASTTIKAFQMQKWSRQKNGEARWERVTSLTKELGGELIGVPGSWLKIAEIDPETDMSLLSVQDILDVAGAGVSFSGSFNLFCEECNIYQLWTQEYVEGLAGYLLDRTNAFKGDTIVLDVGSGDGYLAQLLRESFESDAPRERRRPRGTQRSVAPPRQVKPNRIPDVVATDDRSRNILPGAGAPVEMMDVHEALEKFCGDGSRQVIVICSWMPMGMDWSAAFRDSNVDEYILIGEYDDGNCGDNWRTWGNMDSRIDNPGGSSKGEVADISIPPLYESEGYKRVELGRLSEFHFSRFDSAVYCGSKTFSFRRKRGQ